MTFEIEKYEIVNNYYLTKHLCAIGYFWCLINPQKGQCLIEEYVVQIVRSFFIIHGDFSVQLVSGIKKGDGAYLDFCSFIYPLLLKFASAEPLPHNFPPRK